MVPVWDAVITHGNFTHNTSFPVLVVFKTMLLVAFSVKKEAVIHLEVEGLHLDMLANSVFLSAEKSFTWDFK